MADTTPQQRESSDRYVRDLLSLAYTLIDKWGYDRSEIGRVKKLQYVIVGLDLDVPSQSGYELVPTYVNLSDLEDIDLYFTPPSPDDAQKIGRVAVGKGVGITSTLATVEMGFDDHDRQLEPSKGDYSIPSFPDLLLNDSLYSNLNIREDVNPDGQVSCLTIPREHPLYEQKGSLHVHLLTEWIQLLNDEEKVRFGVYPKSPIYGIISPVRAAELVARGNRAIRAFTTKPGPHCIFNRLDLDVNRETHCWFVTGLDVVSTRESVENLANQGFHFFVRREYNTHENAMHALIRLRRAALKLQQDSESLHHTQEALLELRRMSLLRAV